MKSLAIKSLMTMVIVLLVNPDSKMVGITYCFHAIRNMMSVQVRTAGDATGKMTLKNV